MSSVTGLETGDTAPGLEGEIPSGPRSRSKQTSLFDGQVKRLRDYRGDVNRSQEPLMRRPYIEDNLRAVRLPLLTRKAMVGSAYEAEMPRERGEGRKRS